MNPPIVHDGQRPEALKAELLASLKQGIVPPKFLYSSPRQSELWLALHEQYAPTESLQAPYLEAVPYLPIGLQSMIALGCGGGEKEIAMLQAYEAPVTFTPSDVSPSLARLAASRAQDAGIATGTPLVFDLAEAANIRETIHARSKSPRVFTFFGIIPNFRPPNILPQTRALMDPEDYLVTSANLAPDGINAILPQYDNAPTRCWLEQFLTEHNIANGELRISTRSTSLLEWVQADYVFYHDTITEIGAAQIRFEKGSALQLFISHRYTPESMVRTFGEFGIQVDKTFLSSNGEEGVFLCRPQ